MKHGDRLAMCNSLKFYRTFKSFCMKRGMTELRAVIYATLALEEIMRDPSCTDKIPMLATIGAVAIPEMEKLSPMDEVEEAEKLDMLDAYSKGDQTKLEEMLAKWQRAKQGIKTLKKRNQTD